MYLCAHESLTSDKLLPVSINAKNGFISRTKQQFVCYEYFRKCFGSRTGKYITQVFISSWTEGLCKTKWWFHWQTLTIARENKSSNTAKSHSQHSGTMPPLWLSKNVTEVRKFVILVHQFLDHLAKKHASRYQLCCRQQKLNWQIPFMQVLEQLRHR